MKKITAAVIAALFALSALIFTGSAASSGVPEAYKALHAMTQEQIDAAEYLLAQSKDPAPAVSNEPVTAEHEDGDVSLWFDHSYNNTPAEDTRSTGLNTYQIRLAKNETEGCHLLLAASKDMEGLTLKVSSFKNADGKKLDKEVCYGWYFDDVDGKTVADPIPVLEHEFDLDANRSKMFVIKVKSDKDTPAGQYTATVKLKDADGNVIKQANVYAYVWDFTLPDASYCKTLTDLNEWSMIVGANREKTTTDGLEDDLYSVYYEYLLDNKVNCYTLPYAKRGQFWDARVEQYMDDPRCTAFTLFWKHHEDSLVDGKYLDAYLEAAYNRVSKKQEWLDKAYFYPDKGDEPLTITTLNNIKTWNAQFTQYFGDHKLLIPIHYDTLINQNTDFFKYLENDVNVWCPKTYFFNTNADKVTYPDLYTQFYTQAMEEKLGVFRERMAEEQAGGDEVWWYVTRFPHDPEITFSINDESVKHRILFWQSKLYDIDGVLYYMCNDWENAKQWTKKYEHDVNGTVVDTYGNGVLIYPGGALEEYREKYGSDGYPGPIGSLRLESIRDGVEDYDYFTLLDQKFGEGASDLMIKQVTTALGEYSTDTDLFDRIRTATGNLLATHAGAGDVNRDGKVNNKDITALFGYNSGSMDESMIDLFAADCNGDGDINNKDVMLLFKSISGYDVDIFYGRLPQNNDSFAIPDLPDDPGGDEPTGTPYQFDRIEVLIPDNYTTKDFSGLPSGLRNGTPDGTCFFNFSKQTHTPTMTEASAKALLDLSPGAGKYVFRGFESYEIDGVPVTKYDYSWNDGLIIQSVVRVYFAEGDDVIQFAALSTIPEGKPEFDAMIKTLRIK